MMTKEMFAEFNTEMNRLKAITWKGYKNTLNEIGIAYLGSVSCSAKLRHSEQYSMVNTYGIYLNPDDAMTGFNICPNNEYCKENCLNGSGHNKIDRLSNSNKIDKARTIKTRLFFANRPIFMKLMLHEMEREQRRAKLVGHFFACRLNCTSDINPCAFKLNGKNILEIMPEVVFYGYTKVPSRLSLVNDYANYNLTFSIDGSEENLKVGLDYIEKGGKVAVVYGEDTMPKAWYGYETEDGDLTDYRPNDIKPVIMLKFKKTANNYKNGVFKLPNTKFIVTKDNEHVEW